MLETFLNLTRVQSMIDELLEESSFIRLLVGLIESEVGIVFF